jgi:hypothetical protein
LRAALARELISKITRAKQTESMAQVVEGLLCQREALTSNTSPTKQTMLGQEKHKFKASWGFTVSSRPVWS